MQKTKNNYAENKIYKYNLFVLERRSHIIDIEHGMIIISDITYRYKYYQIEKLK